MADASETTGRPAAAAIGAAEATPRPCPLGPEPTSSDEDAPVEGPERASWSGPAAFDVEGAAFVAAAPPDAGPAFEPPSAPTEPDAEAALPGWPGDPAEDDTGIAPPPSWPATEANDHDPPPDGLVPPRGAAATPEDGRDGRPPMMRNIHPAGPADCALTELVRGGDGAWWL